MEQFNYYLYVLKNYANFEGRARRSEFWWFALFNFIIVRVLTAFFPDSFVAIYNLAVFIPSLALWVRRLHDVGKSGWWFLLAFTIIGILPLLVWAFTDGQKGDNEYGQNPKEQKEDGDMPLGNVISSSETRIKKSPPPPPNRKPKKLIKSEENPGWLWDTEKEDWVPDPDWKNNS